MLARVLRIKVKVECLNTVAVPAPRDGALLEYLRWRGFTNASGVDLSAEQVALARGRGVWAEVANAFELLASKSEEYAAIVVYWWRGWI